MYDATVTYASDVLERFWKKTTEDHDLWFEGSRCIIWTASAGTKGGYGRFWDGKRHWVAHRFAYALVHGEPPPEFEVDHRCRRHLCVNVKHLEAVTRHENQARYEAVRVYQLTCSRGHLWTRENWGWNRSRDGYQARRCNQCNRENAAKARTTPIPKRKLADLSPECRKGHRRTIKNTRFDSAGVAICRDCQRISRARWAAKQKA